MIEPDTNDDRALGVSRRNLNFLYTLDAILNSNSLTEAALATKLSQPAISIALQKARIQFNDPLINSKGAHRFTNLAEHIRPKVRKLLLEANYILDFNLKFDHRIDKKNITISMPEFIEVTLLPRISKLLRSKAPNIKLTNTPFRDSSTRELLEANIDFVIIPNNFKDTAFGYQFLYDDNLSIILCNKKNRAIKSLSADQYKNGVHAALFGDFEMLAPTTGPVADLLAARRVVVRTGAYASLPHILIETDLIATTSSRYAQDCSTTLPVIVLPLPVERDYIDIGVQWQPFRDRDPMVQWFKGLLQEAAEPLHRHMASSAIA